ncbi:hypothetical protein WJX73_010423 [Symbiochloris irregularis]|uniref:Uncharacterized protein n=1 Tax=Symbiochloris irregularis TaxID=706552 RepID=A0AAW1P7I5_9CHLO
MAQPALYWPPLNRLYDALSPAGEQDLEILLRRYGNVLAQGTAVFKSPDPLCLKALQTQSLLFGADGPKVPIKEELREAALALSVAADLNEAQAYIFAWRQREQEEFSRSRGSQRVQLLMWAYCEERNCLLSCTEALLNLQRDVDPSEDAGLLAQLAKAKLQAGDLQESFTAQLEKSLDAGDAFPGSSVQGASSLVVAANGSGGAHWQDAMAKQHIREACLLMELLLLAWACQRHQAPTAPAAQPWPHARFMRLAPVLHRHLLANPRPPERMLGPDGQRADHLAVVVLLEALDLQRLLAALASLLAQSLCPGLSWPAASDCGAKAWDLRVLEYVAGMMHHNGLRRAGPHAMLFQRPFQLLLAATLAAVDLPPSTLAAAEMEALLLWFEGVFEGQPELCQELWASADSPSNPQMAPLRHWMHQTAALFPAFPSPLLRILRCMSSDATSAAAADAYLKGLGDLACLHHEHEVAEGTVAERGPGGRIRAVRWLPIVDLPGLDVPEGIVGVRTATPRFAALGGEAVDSVCMVTWQGFARGYHLGHLLLLLAMRSSLTALQQAAQAAQAGAHQVSEIKDALMHLRPVLSLLARFAAESPATILEIVHNTSVASDSHLASGHDASLATLIAQGLDVLAALSPTPLLLLGECFTIAAALAVNMPAYVLSEVSDAHLLDCNWADSEHMATDDSAPDLLHCTMPGLQSLEQSAELPSSCTAVMTGFAAMLQALLNGGMQNADLKGWVFAEALSQPGAAVACLAPALPPDAGTVEQMMTADGEVDRQLQEHLLQCFEPETAQADPELLAAAARLAASAAMHHASLLDVIFFPTALAPAAPDGKENQGGQAPALPPISEGKAGARSSAGAASQQRQSCLDALWRLLSEAAVLYRSCPAAIAQALKLVLTLCQAGSAASRPMQLLRNQAGLWDHLAAAACMGGQGCGNPEPSRPVFSSSALGREEHDAATVDDAWRLMTQGLATEILALNCHLPGCQAALAVWKGSRATDLLQALMHQLAGDVQVPSALLMRLRVSALQATAELLVLCKSDPLLEHRLTLPGSLLGHLSSCSRSALSTMDSSTLVDKRLAQRVGPLYMERLQSCQALSLAFRHASTFAFQEAARLQALQALDALLTLLHHTHVLKGVGPEPLSWSALLLSSLQHMTQVLLTNVRCLFHGSSSAEDLPVAELGARLQLAEQMLSLSRVWLSGRDSVTSWCPQSKLTESVERPLLTAAVLLVDHTPAEVLSALLTQQQAFKAAASALLPLLHLAIPEPSSTPAPQPDAALGLAIGLLTAPPLLRPHHLQKLLSHALRLLQQQSSQPGAQTTQVLLLIQTLAQWLEGAQLLVDQGAMDALLGLVPSIGQGFSQASEPHKSPSKIEVGGAYTADGSVCTHHTRWLAVLGTFGSLLRLLPTNAAVSRAALSLVVAGQQRLLLALEPAAGTRAQPLTLAGLRECEAAAFFLSGLSRLVGEWHAALPGCVPAVRRAASAFVAMAAQPSIRSSVVFHCEAVSPQEKADAEANETLLQMLDGWFAVAAHTSHAGGHGSSAAANSRSPGRRPGRHITWSKDITLSPNSPRSPRLESQGLQSHASDARSGSLQNRRGSSVSMAAADPLGSRRDSRGGSPSPLRGQLSSSPLRSAVVLAPPPVSKHAAAIAETVYAAAAQALLLLCSLAPEVSEEEAAAGLLGPEWPAPEVLQALQHQGVDVSHSAASRRHSPRARRLITSLLAILQGTACLLDRMHVPPSRNHSSEAAASDQAVERLERASGHIGKHQLQED